MWPFSSGKKEARSDEYSPSEGCVPTLGKNLQKYFEYRREDINLNLSPDRVRTLKKILYYHSTLSTTTREYDIFVVSWDVNHLPEPPDDISPLLPPDVWGEPDVIAIGIQRCPASAAPLWSVIVAHSIHKYSPLFKPVSTEAPFDERSGNLIVLFMRQDLLKYVSGYSSKLVGLSPPNAAALRFSFHQSSIAFVCAKLTEQPLAGFALSEPLAGLGGQDVKSLSADDLEKLHNRLAQEALLRQKFASMATCLHFDVDGEICAIDEHPIIVWMGLKDYNQKGVREEKLINSIFINSKQKSLFGIPASLDPTNPFVALESHSFDIRAVRKVFMGPPFCHHFGTSTKLLCHKTKVRVDILKAGVMRLVLELVDDSGAPTPSEASPELLFIRATIPTVDPNRLRDLYLKAWRILRTSDNNELPRIRLEPHVVQIPHSLSPWVPYTFSFKIINTSKSKLPAPFTVFCVSDSGNFVLPLGRHSFLHQSKAVLRKTRPNVIVKSDAAETLASARAEDSKRIKRDVQVVATSPGVSPLLSAADIQKKVGTLRKIAGRNFGHSWLVRTARGSSRLNLNSRNLNEKHGDRPASLSTRSSNAKSKSLLSGLLPYKKSRLPAAAPNPEPSDCTNVADKEEAQDLAIEVNTPTTAAPKTPCSTNVTLAGDSTSPLSKGDFTLTKWILVEPLEGVVLYGKELEIQMTILIQEGFLEELELSEPITLIIRVDNCNRDFFLGVEIPRIDASLNGLGPNQLQELVARPLQPVAETSLPSSMNPVTTERQINQHYLASPSSARTRRASFMSPALTQLLPSRTALPMPKEIWHLLTFVHQRVIYELDQQHVSLPAAWLSATDDKICPGSWFCLPLFLQRASQGWDSSSPQVRKDLSVVRECVHTHRQIPASVSIEAALCTLERWAMSLPVPLVPREYIADIAPDEKTNIKEEDSSHVHLVCRATLLSLPMLARNILLSLASLIRELLLFHHLTMELMLKPSIAVIVESPIANLPALRQFSDSVERAVILQNLLAPDTSITKKVRDGKLLLAATTEWVARFVTRDTPAALALPFIRHFIKLA